MRKDKSKFTVKYKKADNGVIGYLPNDTHYPYEDFKDTDEVGFIEITREEWINRPDAAIVEGNSLKPYVKLLAERLKDSRAEKFFKLGKQLKKLSQEFTIEYKGKLYENSYIARVLILTEISRLDDSSTSTYFTAEKERVTLNKADFKAILDLIHENDINLRTQESNLIDKINSAKSLKDIDNINIEIS